MAETTPSLLVVSAHAGDFVWRAGGAIAAATMRGEKATVVCVSYGERGESASQWLQGKSLDEIKTIRRDEASAAGHEGVGRHRRRGTGALGGSRAEAS